MELCSTTFVPADHSAANLVATSLFGDGAAALVIGPSTSSGPKDTPGIELVGSHAELFDNTQELMGWDLDDDGLRVRFGRNIPNFVREHSGPFVEATCARLGIARSQLRHFVVHPGGPRVLTAYQSSVGVDEQAFIDAWSVLQSHGNMASPTMLFVLEQFLARVQPSGELGIMMAVGPGFAAEATVFRH